MASKEERLNELTLKQLRQLAKENDIKLVNKWVFGHPPITKKADIVRLLRDEAKITIRKINKVKQERERKKTERSSSRPRWITRPKYKRVR